MKLFPKPPRRSIFLVMLHVNTVFASWLFWGALGTMKPWDIFFSTFMIGLAAASWVLEYKHWKFKQWVKLEEEKLEALRNLRCPICGRRAEFRMAYFDANRMAWELVCPEGCERVLSGFADRAEPGTH